MEDAPLKRKKGCPSMCLLEYYRTAWHLVVCTLVVHGYWRADEALFSKNGAIAVFFWVSQ